MAIHLRSCEVKERGLFCLLQILTPKELVHPLQLPGRAIHLQKRLKQIVQGGNISPVSLKQGCLWTVSHGCRDRDVSIIWAVIVSTRSGLIPDIRKGGVVVFFFGGNPHLMTFLHGPNPLVSNLMLSPIFGGGSLSEWPEMFSIVSSTSAVRLRGFRLVFMNRTACAF